FCWTRQHSCRVARRGTEYFRTGGQDQAIILRCGNFAFPGRRYSPGSPGSWLSIPDWNFPVRRIVSLNVCPTLVELQRVSPRISREEALANWAAAGADCDSPGW